jgi:hypothetical protein
MPSSTRIDQHDDHGAPDDARIVQDHPARRPGSTCRPGRVRVHEAQISDQLSRRSPKLTECEHHAEVTRIAAEQNHTAPALQRELDKLTPSSRCPSRVNVVPEIEVAAANRLPVMAWLYEQLTSWPRGRPANRQFALAVLVHMATLSRRPEVQSAIRGLRHSPLAMWAFDYPRMPARTSVYDHIDGICERNLTDLAVHANVELIRQLSERRDADGNLLHPNVGKVGVVDASLLQAQLPQHKPNGPAERAAMLNGRWQKVGYIVYTDSNGNVTARCHGHKVVAICDLDSTEPIVWTNVSAAMGERDACRQLLPKLFELWPTCPMHTLVGDSLYDQEEAFAMELEFDWGLHPCFPRAGKVSKAFPHVETKGVPCCAHGLMHRDKAEGFPDAKWRAKTGTPRGARAREDEARIRWRCPINAPNCKPQTTRPRDNARLYTYYPRAGNGPVATKRAALQIRRGSVESVFSSLKGRGVGGKGHHRLKLIGDSPADWVISLAALHLTAARVAHETGAYADAYAAAEHLGYLTEPTEDDPFPHPTIHEARRTAAADPPPRSIAPRSLRRPT